MMATSSSGTVTELLDTMPWRLASFAGLVVGVVSFATGSSDTWAVLVRVGIAFSAFFIVGWAAKAVLSIAAGETTVRASSLTNGGAGEDAAGAESHVEGGTAY